MDFTESFQFLRKAIDGKSLNDRLTEVYEKMKCKEILLEMLGFSGHPTMPEIHEKFLAFGLDQLDDFIEDLADRHCGQLGKGNFCAKDEMQAIVDIYKQRLVAKGA